MDSTNRTLPQTQRPRSTVELTVLHRYPSLSSSQLSEAEVRLALEVSETETEHSSTPEQLQHQFHSTLTTPSSSQMSGYQIARDTSTPSMSAYPDHSMDEDDVFYASQTTQASNDADDELSSSQSSQDSSASFTSGSRVQSDPPQGTEPPQSSQHSPEVRGSTPSTDNDGDETMVSKQELSETTTLLDPDDEDMLSDDNMPDSAIVASGGFPYLYDMEEDSSELGSPPPHLLEAMNDHDTLERWRLARAHRHAEPNNEEEDIVAEDDGNHSDDTEIAYNSDAENLPPSVLQARPVRRLDHGAQPLVSWRTELALHIDSQLSDASTSSLTSPPPNGIEDANTSDGLTPRRSQAGPGARRPPAVPPPPVHAHSSLFSIYGDDDDDPQGS